MHKSVAKAAQPPKPKPKLYGWWCWWPLRHAETFVGGARNVPAGRPFRSQLEDCQKADHKPRGRFLCRNAVRVCALQSALAPPPESGRTHGCTDQACDVKILLANLEVIGRVEDWRAGLGRSLCSPLSRPFVCGCHTISTVPRFQPPPRRTQHADFPHCALLFASPQGLWDLFCRGDFRQRRP
jgi:hypothetical protein